MNWKILTCGLFFNLMETAYFGWHLWPSSQGEIICDGICAVIFALAFLNPSERGQHE